jgi:acetyltransferase-like isoleucine patch superfamily enzyme
MVVKNVIRKDSVEIIEPVNLYGCFLDENVFIGPFVEVQENVIIKKNTRVQSHTFICSNVSIGENCFIGHGVVFTNDKFENGKVNYSTLSQTKIGDNVLIGSNSSILPVNICDNVVIGAGSVVTKDISKPGKYAGNPASKINSENP